MNRREFLAAAAAAPSVLRSGQRALALVTADTESAVVGVDPFAGRVVRRIATRADPRSIERVGETAVVAHTAVGEVTLLRSFAVRHVLRGFGEPRYTAASPGGRYAYVTDSGRADLAVVDVVRARVVARLHLGGWPRHVSIDAPGGRYGSSRRSSTANVTAATSSHFAVRNGRPSGPAATGSPPTAE